MSLLLFVCILSCSESDDSKDDQQQAQGSVSFAFIDGGGFVMENIVATISNNYETTNTLTIRIKANSEGNSSGILTLNIVDNDANNEAFKIDEEYSYRSNADPIYLTATYVDTNTDFKGTTGRVRVSKYEENVNGNSKSIKINAIFNITGGFKTMLGNISGLVLNCEDCQNM